MTVILSHFYLIIEYLEAAFMKNTPSDEKLLLHQSRQRFAGILRINKKL
jgi:hypothetical protein